MWWGETDVLTNGLRKNRRDDRKDRRRLIRGDREEEEVDDDTKLDYKSRQTDFFRPHR